MRVPHLVDVAAKYISEVSQLLAEQLSFNLLGRVITARTEMSVRLGVTSCGEHLQVSPNLSDICAHVAITVNYRAGPLLVPISSPGLARVTSALTLQYSMVRMIDPRILLQAG